MSVAGIPFRMIDQPTQAMQTAVEKPKSWWLVALLILVSLAALAVLSAPYSAEMANATQERMLERLTARLSEEQAAQALAQVQPQLPRRLAITTTITGLIGLLIGWVVRAAIYHFSSMAMGGQSAWPGTFAMTAWASLPFFFRNILQAVYVYVRGELVPQQGLGFLVATGDALADAQSAAYVALSQVEPFALWHLALLTIGLAVAIKLSKSQAALLAIVVWGLGVGLQVLLAVVGSGLTRGLLG